MEIFPKLFLILGILFIGIALIWNFAGNVIPLGKLPGDFTFGNENFKFYFPLATSIILSVLITIIFWIINASK